MIDIEETEVVEVDFGKVVQWRGCAHTNDSIGLTEPHDTQDEKSKQLVSKELHEKKKNAQHNGNEN